MTQKEINKAVELYRENPFWKELYDDAPEGAKEYLAATFAASESDDESASDFVKGVEKRLDDEDRKWLAKNLPNAQARAHFKNKED